MKQSVSFAGKLFDCFLPLFVSYGCQLVVSYVGIFVYTGVITAKAVASGMSEEETAHFIQMQLLNLNDSYWS